MSVIFQGKRLYQFYPNYTLLFRFTIYYYTKAFFWSPHIPFKTIISKPSKVHFIMTRFSALMLAELKIRYKILNWFHIHFLLPVLWDVSWQIHLPHIEAFANQSRKCSTSVELISNLKWRFYNGDFLINIPFSSTIIFFFFI